MNKIDEIRGHAFVTEREQKMATWLLDKLKDAKVLIERAYPAMGTDKVTAWKTEARALLAELEGK